MTFPRLARCGAWISKRWTALDLDIQDVHFYGGLVLIGWGGWQLSHAGAAIGVGLVLMLSNLGPAFASRLSGRKE